MAERDDESSADLFQYLEHASGRKLRTREDVRRLLDELSAKSPAGSRAMRLWRTGKQGMWLLLLVTAFLQYYLLDVLVGIDSLPEIRVSVPVTVSQSNRAFRF
jgi:hypothetical protein